MAGVQIDGVNNKIDFDDDLDTSISANTDDTLVIEAGGNTMATITATTFTINDGTTITTADNTDTLTLTSTDADANVGPNLVLYRNSASPADSDDIGAIRFDMRNDNNQDFTAVNIRGDCGDMTDGTEDAQIEFQVMTAGTLREYMRLTSGSAPNVTFNEASQDIDFRVESNGNDHMIFVDGGNDHVNIGTATDLGGMFNVGGNGVFQNADQTDTLSLVNTDADANVGPRLKFFRNSSSPADGDLTGDIRFESKNDAGQDVIAAQIKTNIGDVRDGLEYGEINFHAMVNGTLTEFMALASNVAPEVVFNEQSADIDFRVESNGQGKMLYVNAGKDSLHIADAGTEDHRLIVQHDGSNEAIARFKHSDGTPEGLIIQFTGGAPDGASANFLECSDTGTTRLIIRSDGDIQNHDNAYNAISDERIKEQIKDSSSQWDDIKAMKIRKYKMKDDVAAKGDSDALWRIGVIAQELEASGMNGLVNDEVLYEEGEPNMGDNKAGDMKNPKAVKYSILYMKSIKALQEAQTRIETLETKVAALEG